MSKTSDVQDAFWSKVEKTSTCWIWHGSVTTSGYGQLKYNGKRWRAYAFSFMLAGNTLPQGKELHHECGNRLCVRPDHLAALSHAEHLSLHKTLRQFCKRGHPWISGASRCQACYLAGKLKWRLANKEKMRAYLTVYYQNNKDKWQQQNIIRRLRRRITRSNQLD